MILPYTLYCKLVVFFAKARSIFKKYGKHRCPRDYFAVKIHRGTETPFSEKRFFEEENQTILPRNFCRKTN